MFESRIGKNHHPANEPHYSRHAGDDRPGRVTMRGISRWTEKGGSYRTVQRFFYTALPWATLFWLFFRHHLWQPGRQYLLVGDESIATKAGNTHGLDHFFSSLYGRVVPSLAFFALSPVDVTEQ
jgi:putative transposase